MSKMPSYMVFCMELSTWRNLADILILESRNHACNLNKDLYWLKQAPWAWFHYFSIFWRILVLFVGGLIPPYLFLVEIHAFFTCSMLTIQFSLEVTQHLYVVSSNVSIKNFSLKISTNLIIFLDWRSFTRVMEFFLGKTNYARDVLTHAQ